jgi:hypothetical protein
MVFFVRSEAGHIGGHEHDLAAAHALAQVVIVGLTFEGEQHAVGGEGAKDCPPSRSARR